MKRRFALTVVASLVGLLGLLGLTGLMAVTTDCAPTASSTPARQSAGESFSIAIGESVSLEGLGISITFSAVTRDSRCPKDAKCVVAGEAVVIFQASRRGAITDLTFKIPPDGSDAQELEELSVTITELEPPAESGKRIDPASYTAKVTVKGSG